MEVCEGVVKNSFVILRFRMVCYFRVGIEDVVYIFEFFVLMKVIFKEYCVVYVVFEFCDMFFVKLKGCWYWFRSVLG